MVSSTPSSSDSFIGASLLKLTVPCTLGSTMKVEPVARATSSMKARMSASRTLNAQTIDDGALSLEAENARARVGRLWARRHGSAFGKTEAHGEHGVGHLAVLFDT